MTVHHVTGDLFDPSWGFDAIAHGVNCKGLMGAGIAVKFRKDFRIMYERYKRMCDEGFLLPGMVMPYNPANADFRIYNIASQYLPGPDAKLSYLKAGLQYTLFHMQEQGVKTLGLPRIGAGIGGLTFNDVHATVLEVFANVPHITATIVSLGE
jgi:O-acetyl-ADP-ribose deacetylase (regulator of RNase III)